MTRAKKALFLEVFPAEGTVTHAAARVGIAPVTHYRWLKDDPEYVAAFHEAEIAAFDNMEREARRRAVEGTDEPVYQGGKLVGHIRKFSDTLLIFLMKGANPSKYRERVDVTLDVRHAVERLTTDPLEREAAMAEVERILAEART